MTNRTRDAARLELAQRIGALVPPPPRSTPVQLACDLDAIRRLAAETGFGAMPPIIHAIEAALGRGERGAHLAGSMALLNDALACGNDPRAVAALTAACSRRIAG